MTGIFFSIDYYTAMFYDVKPVDVIAWCGLDPEVVCDDFFKSRYEQKQGVWDEVRFVYNYVMVQIRSHYLYGKSDDDLSIFDMEIPEVRLDLSGQALDFLRGVWKEKGKSLDDVLRDQSYLLPRQNVTRCDFAFDFVNYKPDCLRELIDYVQNNHTVNDRVLTLHQTSAMVYELKLGGQMTLYLGSKQSDKFLRVYDKRLERSDGYGSYCKPNDYCNPDSWIRFEWQTRRLVAQALLFAEYEGADFNSLSLLKEMYKTYTFADLSTPKHRREAATFWQDLFDWQIIPSIIQNKNVVSMVKPYAQRRREQVPMIQHALLDNISLGEEQFEQAINSFLFEVFTDTSPKSLKIRNSYLSGWNQLGSLERIFDNKSSALYVSNHIPKFSFSRRGVYLAYKFLLQYKGIPEPFYSQLLSDFIQHFYFILDSDLGYGTV